jgi:hypothetical protein
VRNILTAIFSLSTLVALVPVPALAQEIPSMAPAQYGWAGVVTTLEGTVTVTRASTRQPSLLKFKDDVFVQDRVMTGDRSFARLLLGGKAVVTVREHSVLTITETPGKSTIDLASGKIGLAVAREKMRSGESVEIRTPNALAGVRGTVVIAEVLQASAQAGAAVTAVHTNFYVLRGRVEVFHFDPRTGGPIGTPVSLTVLQRFGATGGAPPTIAPIPSSEVPHVTSGLSPRRPQFTDAANPEQLRAQQVDHAVGVATAIVGPEVKNGATAGGSNGKKDTQSSEGQGKDGPDRSPIAKDGPDKSPIVKDGPDRAPIVKDGPDKSPVVKGGPDKSPIVKLDRRPNMPPPPGPGPAPVPQHRHKHGQSRSLLDTARP